MKRMLIWVIGVCLISGLLTGCNGEEQVLEDPKKSELLYCATEVMIMLKEKDFEKLAHDYVDETKGLRFSPYAFIDKEKDVKLTSEQVKNLATDSNIRNWGSYDGSGEPISINFESYYKDFVYNQDFVNPDKIGFNKAISSGNTTNNMKEAYPSANFVEFLYEGSEANAQIDWASISLVFEKKEGTWKLVGIVHSQWTI